MACALTQGNTLGCNDGFGGIKEFYVANAEDITLTYTTGVVTAIAKATGKRFWKYVLTPFTGEASFEAAGSRETQSSEVKQTISFVINKLSASLRAELNLMVAAQMKVVVVDNNGNAWMYGQDYGMYAPNVKGMTGKSLKDRNGYEIGLEAIEKESPPSVQFSLVAALETPGV